MGSKKHKKHKSERREKCEDRPFCLERPPGLKLILKVGGGNSSTPEYGSSESPVYGVQPENLGLLLDYPERHKKSKKKKKKKDREKKHKHHKEKRRHCDESRERTTGKDEPDDSSQEDFSVNEDSVQFQSDCTTKYNLMMGDSNSLASGSVARTPLLSLPMKSPVLEPFTPPSVPLTSEQSPSVSSVRSDSIKSTSSTSDTSGREPRTCVLKLKQSKSPLLKLLEHLLRILEKKDPHQFFAWPVTDDIAPGYSSIISNPMDFLTIRQKVEENQYNSLQEFTDDFRLMCENAIKYNHIETVYHKAAKRLLHVGNRMLQPDSVVRILRPLPDYMQELSQSELGFDMNTPQNVQGHENDAQIIDSADEGMSTEAEEINAAQFEEDEKRRNIRLENEPRTRFEPYVDNLTPDEILAQVQSAAQRVKKTLAGRKNLSKMGFLRQKKDGTTSMQILIDADNSCPERVVSIGAFTGKLQQGTGHLQGFREDRRNNAKIVKPLNYGTFCSFAPVYDSRFSNLNKEESELVLNTYGDNVGSEYTASIIEFSKDSHHASTLANSLLDFLTNGEHRKTMATLMESSRQKHEQCEIEQSFPNPTSSNTGKKLNDEPIDFDSLRTLSDIGVNVDFLNEMEEDMRTIQFYNNLQNKLKSNSELIERLNKVQNERLSHNLPAHLSHVAHPDADEIDLATQITTNLTDMAKQLPPQSIVSTHALRKAMGLSNVGLQPIGTPYQQKKNKLARAIDTTPTPMETESEHSSSIVHHPAQPVDLESELREFLEGGTENLTTADDVGIDQMLMN